MPTPAAQVRDAERELRGSARRCAGEPPCLAAREHAREVGVHQFHPDEHVDAAAASVAAAADDRRAEQRDDVRRAVRAPRARAPPVAPRAVAQRARAS